MADQNKLSPKDYPGLYSYGSNELGARNIHIERIIYRDGIFPENLIVNSMSTWSTDRFYGIVNTKGNTVVPDQKFLKPLYFTDNQSQFALNFVADAWYDLSQRLRELGDQNIIFRNSPWLEPTVVKAWNPATVEYDDYMRNIVYRYFIENFLPLGNKERRIRNINDFLNVFDEYIDLAVSLVGPTTFSGYIEGVSLSPLMSGLMIEISDETYSDDFTKSYEFLDDNFELVSNIVAQYGFSIDRNIPWRLIADLRSPAMQEYMYGVPIDEFEDSYPDPLPCDPTLLDQELAPMAFGYSQVPGMETVKRRIAVHFDEDGNPQPGYQEYQPVKDASSQEEVFEILFETAYDETWKNDVDLLQKYIIGFYNTYVTSAPTVSVREQYVQIDCIPKTEVVARNIISEEEFRATFGDRWKLKTFYVSRLSERDPDRTARIKRKQIQQMMNIYNLSSENRYMRSLRYAQEEYIGPYDTNPLTLRTVGDIIGSTSTREDDAVPNIRRQNRVRRNLY
tara:strand:- start:2962 stop:4482 length:1521 start_codon:yes stop_codon:yes gene_type:complete